MANIIPGVDDYGVDLIALKERAIAEDKAEHAEIFEAAIKEAQEGKTEWYTRICRDIGFMITNTTMDALQIDVNHIRKEHACCAPEEFIEE